MTSGACGTILLHNSFANGLPTLVREEVGRPHLKNGDVLMYRGRSLESRIVRWVTRSEYSHAGLAVWWNGRLMVMEAVGRGVIVTPRSKNALSSPGFVEWFTSVEEIHWRCRLVSDPQRGWGRCGKGATDHAWLPRGSPCPAVTQTGGRIPYTWDSSACRLPPGRLTSPARLPLRSSRRSSAPR